MPVASTSFDDAYPEISPSPFRNKVSALASQTNSVTQISTKKQDIDLQEASPRSGSIQSKSTPKHVAFFPVCLFAAETSRMQDSFLFVKVDQNQVLTADEKSERERARLHRDGMKSSTHRDIVEARPCFHCPRCISQIMLTQTRRRATSRRPARRSTATATRRAARRREGRACRSRRDHRSPPPAPLSNLLAAANPG